jgi:amphiphysin
MSKLRNGQQGSSPPPLKPKLKLAGPKKQCIVALFDFEALADGDLDFKAGDNVEIVQRTPSTENQ